MNTETSTLSGPDLTLGIPLSTLPEGAMLQGHAGGEAVLLVRRAGRLFAVGAFCTHYGAPLVGGLVVEERSEEHTSELQSLMRISYAVFCLKKKKKQRNKNNTSATCHKETTQNKITQQ